MNTLYRKKLRRVLFIFKTLLYLFILILSLLLKVFKKYRDIWIISERGDDARDNGYYFFEYLMSQRNRPDVYYIIDKKSQYTKIKEYTNVIHRSVKALVVFLPARIKISTYNGYSLTGICLPAYRFRHSIWQKVFTTRYYKNNILHYPNVKLDYLSAEQHQNLICAKNFGHQGCSQIHWIGTFCNLHDFDVNQQILMPTWRQYLKGCPNQSSN